MQTEIEAKFLNINKVSIRGRLKDCGGKIVTPERLMRRSLGGENFRKGEWLRLRDEGDKVTLTFKSRRGETVDNTSEIEVEVSEFEATKLLLEKSGFHFFAYQENKRESWVLDNVQVEIDTWPGLQPHVEIEAKDEQTVRAAANKLGLEWGEACFKPADVLYAEENGISRQAASEVFNNLRFDDDHPRH